MCVCRVHLQHRIEDKHKCAVLRDELRQQVLHTHGSEISDRAVLETHYIHRVLQLRKVAEVSVRAPLSDVCLTELSVCVCVSGSRLLAAGAG